MVGCKIEVEIKNIIMKTLKFRSKEFPKRIIVHVFLLIIIFLSVNGFQKLYSQTYGTPLFFDDFGVVPAGQDVNSYRGDIIGRGSIGTSYWYWPGICPSNGGWLSQSDPTTELTYDIDLPAAEDGVTSWVFVPATRSTSTNGTDPYTTTANINNPNNLWSWGNSIWTKNPSYCTGIYSRWYSIDGTWHHGHWERLWYKKWVTCSNWHSGMDDGGYALTANPDYTHGNDHAWLAGSDHTPGDVNGMMLVVNAAFVKGQFYKRVIPGLCYGSQFEFKTYYANILSSSAACSPGIPINIRFEVWDKDPGDDEINSTILVGGKASNGATLIAFNNTGDIPGGSSTLIWKENNLIFEVPQNQDNVVIILRNNGVGGCGNDLAIDDISFRPYRPFSIGYETNIDNYCSTGFVTQKGVVTSGTVPIGSNYYYQWQETAEGTANWTDLGSPVNSLYNVELTQNVNDISNKIFRVISSTSLQNLNNSNCYVASSNFDGNSIHLPIGTISGDDVCGTDLHSPIDASFNVNYNGSESSWIYYYRINDGEEQSQIVNSPATTDTKTISITGNSKVELLRIATKECNIGFQINNIHNISYSVEVPAIPNVILGPNPACIGDVAGFSIQDVPGAVSYTWIVSGGWQILSGQGTCNVKLKIGSTPIHVQITTKNACGSNAWTSAAFQITNGPPDIPANILAPNGLCLPAIETEFSDFLFECSMINNTSNYIWDWDSSISLGSQVSGTGQYLRQIILSVPNHLSTFNVRVRSQNACGYSAVKEVTFNTTSIPEAVTGYDRTICFDSKTNIGAESVVGSTYNWTSLPTGFTSTIANPLVSPLMTTIYVLVETNAFNGCSNSNSIIVTVEDLINPTITAPAAVTGTTNGNCTSTNVDLGLPISADNCSVVRVSNNAPTDFPLGQSTVTWTVTNVAGLTATATQLVTVTDNINPITPTLADVTVGECSGTPDVPTTTDNCLGTVTGTTTTIFPITTQGTKVVTWSFDDGNGNVTTASQNVIVDDITAPVPEVATLADATGECSVTVTSPIAIDNCKGAIVGTTADPLTYSVQGSYTIHWTYDDGNGNISIQTQNVKVDDITPPVKPVLADVIVGECSGTPPTPTTTDNCKGTVFGTTSILFPKTKQGKHTIIWTFDDGNGNVTTAYQNLIVADVTAPVVDVVSLPTITGECSVTVQAPTATDNCKGSITGTTEDPTEYTVQGSYTIHWTYYDGNGNTSTQLQSVVVEDITAPVPEVATLADATGECSVTVTSPTATDNCKGAIVGTTADPLTYSVQGSYTIHWTYDDGNGNISIQTQNVKVDDTTPPEITGAITQTTVEGCVAEVVAPSVNTIAGLELLGLSISDACSANTALIVTSNETYTGLAPIVVSRTYTITDAGHNATKYIQSILLVDTQKPTITCPANINVIVDSGKCTVSGLSLGTPITADNCSLPFVRNDAPETFPLGLSIVTWTVTDESGNIATCNQTVTVNGLPIAVDDFVFVNENAPISGNVMDNDQGLCNMPVLVKDHTEPVHGNLTITGDGRYTYTPNDHYYGTDTFTYQICDFDGDCSVAKVTITVEDVNDLPLAIDDLENIQLDLVLEATVADNDILSNDGGNVWTLLDLPANGTILFHQDGSYSYTPGKDFLGRDNFTYKLCDVDGDCSEAKVSIIIEDVLSANQILTPNGDAINDTFIILGINFYPENKLTIYNRWGNVVYHKNNYQNEWDGNSNVSKIGANSLPVGTYYYLIDYGKNRHKTGFVYLDK